MNKALNTELWSDLTVEELETRTEYGFCVIFDMPGDGWCFWYSF